MLKSKIFFPHFISWEIENTISCCCFCPSFFPILFLAHLAYCINPADLDIVESSCSSCKQMDMIWLPHLNKMSLLNAICQNSYTLPVAGWGGKYDRRVTAEAKSTHSHCRLVTFWPHLVILQWTGYPFSSVFSPRRIVLWNKAKCKWENTNTLSKVYNWRHMRWWFKLGFSARRNKIISHASFYFVGFHYQKLWG